MAALTGYAGAFSADTSTVDSSKQHQLGTRAFDTAGNEYIYLTGVASTAVASVIVYDEAFLTTLAAANAQGAIACAMAATVANKYGWYQIFGSGTAKVLASFADNGKCYLTSTAGSIDDADVAGDGIIGMWGRSAIASGTATVQLNYPMVHDLAFD